MKLDSSWWAVEDRFLLFLFIFLIFLVLSSFSVSAYSIGVSPNKLLFNSTITAKTLTLFNTNNALVYYDISVKDYAELFSFSSKKGKIEAFGSEKIVVSVDDNLNVKVSTEISVLFSFDNQNILPGADIRVEIENNKEKKQNVFIGFAICLVIIVFGLIIYRNLKRI